MATHLTRDRAQEIVDIARQRVASMGGKASMLPAMIEKVTEEFRGMDNTARGRDRATGVYEMPNNIDRYIDEVLRMSGMMGSEPSAAPAPSGPSVDEMNAATTTGTVGTAPVDEVERADLAPVDGEESETADAGLSDWWKIIGGVGAAAAGVHLLDRYPNRKAAEQHIPSNPDTPDVRASNMSDDPSLDRAVEAEGDPGRQSGTDLVPSNPSGQDVVAIEGEKMSALADIASAEGFESALQYARENGISLNPREIRDLQSIGEDFESTRNIDSEIGRTLSADERPLLEAPREQIEPPRAQIEQQSYDGSNTIRATSQDESALRIVANARTAGDAIRQLRGMGMDLPQEYIDMLTNDFARRQQIAKDMLTDIEAGNVIIDDDGPRGTVRRGAGRAARP